ncbi:hypothetical protein ACFWN2_01210 [Lentzea sp. NPDC058436]|uniref:hypothetical protein n=1 Tax=Lentzea sp. NPDC058436 TaxID=3346499 RepID=UPI00366997AE
MTPEQLSEITGGTTGLRVLDPDDLAETCWRLFTGRSQIEYRFPGSVRNGPAHGEIRVTGVNSATAGY